MTRATLTAALAASLLALPAFAQAPTEYRGKTSQGKRARVVVAPDGAIQRIDIYWRMTCRRGGAWFAHATKSLPPLDKDGAEFYDAGSYWDRFDRFRLKISGDVGGTFSADRSSVSGTALHRARVYRRGRLVNRCSTGRVTWTAARQ